MGGPNQTATLAKYYRKHREYWLANGKRLRDRDLVDCRALKLLRGCMDCGYDANADVLQFDHRPGETKLAAVSTFRGSPNRLAAEIAKCDVVCANCHAIRTADRRKLN